MVRHMAQSAHKLVIHPGSPDSKPNVPHTECATHWAIAFPFHLQIEQERNKETGSSLDKIMKDYKQMKRENQALLAKLKG